jgi:hypothetical protein
MGCITVLSLIMLLNMLCANTTVEKTECKRDENEQLFGRDYALRIAKCKEQVPGDDDCLGKTIAW